jgi:hypothetical protein
MAFGSRAPAQVASVSGRKLDGALADLTRHAARARPGSAGLTDLRSMSPAARFKSSRSGAPLVLIDAITRGDPRRLESALVSLGLEHASVYHNDVSGWLPLNAIEAATARSEVLAMSAAMPRTRAGAVTSQGDFAQGSSALRTSWPVLDGSGVLVGILSDSYNCYSVYAAPGSGVPASGLNGYASNGFTADAQHDVSTGDLPASVSVLEEAGQGSKQGVCMDYGAPDLLPYGDEGRAILQIVHDVAPGARLAFHTAVEGKADFANGITALATAGAQVIADDVGYFEEPFFQDGLVAQAVDTVAAQGVVYFSSAGNNGRLAYDNTNPTFNAKSGSPPNASESLLNFDTSGKTIAPSLSVTLPGLAPGEFVGVVVQWDQPFVTGSPGSPGATSNIDLCVRGAAGYAVFDLDGNPVTCTGANATGADPVQVLIIGNPANATANTGKTTVLLQVGLTSGTAPGRVKLAVEDDGAGSTINQFGTNSPTLQGHPGAAGAVAVGAAFFAQTPLCGTSPAVLEPFSSAGGDPILFDTAGQRLATPVVRQKPEFVAPDGANNTFLGATLAQFKIPDNSPVAECANDASFPNFFGTSAAAPHLAAGAALMLQANPALTAADIRTALQKGTQAMGAPSPDYDSGYGFVEVSVALAELPPPTPVVRLTPNTIYVGQVSTLTWLAVNSTSCTVSGPGVSGSTQPASGSQQLSPPGMGSFTYTASCTSSAGQQSSSATLTVQAVSPLSITSASLPGGQVGAAYSTTLAATGGVTPYHWTVASGTLPAGLSLNASSGTLSGTPTAASAAAALTFQVTDSEATVQSKSANLSLTIAAAPSSGGGGGALDWVALAALSGLALNRLRREYPRTPMRISHAQASCSAPHFSAASAVNSAVPRGEPSPVHGSHPAAAL